MGRYGGKMVVGVCVWVLLALAGVAGAVGIVEWRNGGHAVYPDAKPPVAWSTDRNVAWATPLPPKGNASPLIVGDKVFVLAETAQVICLDKATGKILWQKDNPLSEALSEADKNQAALDEPKADAIRKQMAPLNKQHREVRGKMRRDRQNQELRVQSQELRKNLGELKKQLDAVTRFAKPPTHNTNGYASPSPTSDGKFVYAVYGTGVVACYDLEGNRKWIKRFDVPTDNSNWGFSTSPVLAGGKLLVHGRDMQALDPANGETLWKAELRWSWGTCEVVEIGGNPVAVTPKGDFVSVADGKALARKVFEMPWGSPVAHGGIIYAIDERGCKAVEIPATLAAASKPKVLWSKPPPVKDRYYATSVIHDGLVYNVAGNGKKTLVVMDAATGDTVYMQKLDFPDRRQYATMSFAGGNLYLHSEGGDTIIFKPGRVFEQVARNGLEEFRSTPTFQGASMYVRTNKHLYCFSQ